MQQADRRITRAGSLALVGSALAGLCAWLLLPTLIAFPTEPGDRLAFAALATLPLFACLAAAVMMVSTTRRHSPEDIGGSAAGPPSPPLAIKLAFLQNTLEQTVLAAGIFLVFAAVVGGPWLSLLLAGAALFVAGRVLFYRGYRQGAEGRALGMALTMMPTMLLGLIATGTAVLSWL